MGQDFKVTDFKTSIDFDKKVVEVSVPRGMFGWDAIATISFRDQPVSDALAQSVEAIDNFLLKAGGL